MADIDAATAVLRKALGDDLMDGSQSRSEHYVGMLLMDKGLTVGTAESCTGGGIGAALVNVPGSSAYFEGGSGVFLRNKGNLARRRSFDHSWKRGSK